MFFDDFILKTAYETKLFINWRTIYTFKNASKWPNFVVLLTGIYHAYVHKWCIFCPLWNAENARTLQIMSSLCKDKRLSKVLVFDGTHKGWSTVNKSENISRIPKRLPVKFETIPSHWPVCRIYASAFSWSSNATVTFHAVNGQKLCCWRLIILESSSQQCAEGTSKLDGNKDAFSRWQYFSWNVIQQNCFVQFSG